MNAMENFARRELMLDMARMYAQHHPDDTMGHEYVVRMKVIRDEAYMAYTDPFRSKTYA